MEELTGKDIVYRSFIRTSTGSSDPRGFIDRYVSACRGNIGSSFNKDVLMTIGADDLRAKLIARIVREVQIPIVLKSMLLQIRAKGGSNTEDNLRVVERKKNLRKGARSPWWDPWD